MKSKDMQKRMERNFTRMDPVLLNEKSGIESSVGFCKIYGEEEDLGCRIRTEIWSSRPWKAKPCQGLTKI
jgi:hypothetical protein